MRNFCVLGLIFLLSMTAGRAADQNMALNCPVEVSPAPNYTLTGNDAKSLTDGEFTAGFFWTQKTTVGWMYQKYAAITIDLGRVQSISGASFNTAAGASDVGWPECIVMLASDDKQTWRYIGDLVELSAGNPPPADGYSTHRYVTHHVATHGRYVLFAVSTYGVYVFCDEVEVFAGPDEYLGPTYAGEVVASESVLMANQRTRSGIKRRLTDDLTAVDKAVKASNISDADKRELRARMIAIAADTVSRPMPEAEKFRAVYPITTEHARIFNVYSSVLRSKGLPSLVVWKKNRYDYSSPLDLPIVTSALPSVGISMMRNEFRSDALLLTNTADKPVRVSLGFDKLPGAPKPEWLGVYSV
ncbi:MAG TPA: hypothetical protein VGK34_09835, partial [Armatimonadota bacterium]